MLSIVELDEISFNVVNAKVAKLAFEQETGEGVEDAKLESKLNKKL